MTQISRSLFAMACIHVCLFQVTVLADTNPWEGRWHTYWRDGEALVIFKQEGDIVTGTFEPGGGIIEGTSHDGVLRGKWRDKTHRGDLIFALAENNQSFAGQFGNMEYWNGDRIDTEDYRTVMPLSPSYATPRDTLRTILIAANESNAGNIAAPLWFGRGLKFEGTSTNSRDLNRRRRRFLQLLDLCTVHLLSVPDGSEGGEVVYRTGPAATDWDFEITFVQDTDGRWQLRVPPLEVIESHFEDMLDALNVDDLGEWKLQRQHSPRQALRRFVTGCTTWEDGGSELALAVIDLSSVPVQFQQAHGEVIAEYLWQIINRVGWIVWQEIPDDPDRPIPYVFYRHPSGSIVLEPNLAEDGVRWQLSAETVDAAPDIYDSVSTLPVMHDRGAPTISKYFVVRNAIRSISPWLLQRSFWLENWQWFVLLVIPLLGVLAAMIAGRITRSILYRLVSKPADRRGMIWPVRLIACGFILLLGMGEVGLSGDVLGILSLPIVIMVTLGVTWFLVKVTGIIGGVLYARAEQTPGHVDEIVTSLATGVTKVLIIIGGLLFAGKMLGIPYEGMLAGLSIGGLALAIAARDTISNFFGAALMITDRPFRRGDLVDVDGNLAVVETVGLRCSRLRRLDDALLTIPNGRLSDHMVINLGRRRKREVRLEIGLTYDTPRAKLDQFVQQLHEVIETLEDVDSESYVGLKGFGDSSLNIEVWTWFWVTNYTDHVASRHKLVSEIINLSDHVGVSFAFPTRTLHVESSSLKGVEDPQPTPTN